MRNIKLHEEKFEIVNKAKMYREREQKWNMKALSIVIKLNMKFKAGNGTCIERFARLLDIQ